ncbi:MAG: NAD-dependent protein deacylase [Firmicutes bacterium]|nr:NAD-dependent protein deacylase [Bacillota bacterium]
MSYSELTQILRENDNIVFFGGAGVSTESNIPDFRSENGLYNAQTKYGVSPETIISHTYFVNNTEKFYSYYKENLIFKDAKPNKAHIALAKLEEMGKLKAIVTQNIDGLHQLAGSKSVYEVHGSVLRNYCTKCGSFYGVDTILESKGIPKCEKCSGLIKPDVVLYEEGLDDEVWSGAYKAVASAQVLIVGGTSLVVYPAAGLVNVFKGKKLVLINKSNTSFDNMADLVIHDSIGKVLSEAVEAL